jgi:hypothetical protein
VHAPSEDKSDDSKDSVYEELEQFFCLPKYHMKILLGDFNAKVGREDIFNPTIGNESLHQDSNDNGVRLVNYATSKKLKCINMYKNKNKNKFTCQHREGIGEVEV